MTALFNSDHEAWMVENCRMRNDKMTEAFNAHFQSDFTKVQLVRFRKRLGLKSGFIARQDYGANKGSFKPGHSGMASLPLGTEKLATNGRIEVKVAMPNIWRHKHLVVIEKEYGPIPKGWRVLALDDDWTNTDLSNLVLLPPSVAMWIIKNGYKTTPVELRPLLIALAKLVIRTRERKAE